MYSFIRVFSSLNIGGLGLFFLLKYIINIFLRFCVTFLTPYHLYYLFNM